MTPTREARRTERSGERPGRSAPARAGAERRGRPRAAAALAAALLLGALGAPGCASLPGLPSRHDEEPERVVRPEAAPDYDVLVARSAELEGRLADARAAYARAAEKDPDSAYLQRKLAELAARTEDLDAAVAHARRALELAPDDEDVRLFLGTLYRIRRDVAGAEEVLVGEDGAPRSTEAAFLLYQVYLEGGRTEEALALAQQLVKSEPDSLRSHLALATVYDRMGRTEEARAALREAIAREPDRIALYSALARSYREEGDRESEIGVYRDLLKVLPHHHATLVSLAEAQAAAGDTEGAIATLEDVVERNPGDLRSLVRLAFLEYEAGRPERAAARFDQAIAQSPTEWELYFFQGVVLRRAGRFDEAIEAFSRVPPDHRNYVEARTQIAAIHERRGEIGQALEEIERAREVGESRDLDLYYATLRAKNGDLEGAVAFLETLLAQEPDDDELVYNLGVLYGEAKRYDDAIRYMHEALAINPKNASALNYIGYTWAERGENLEQAEVMIKRALELRPDDGYITDSLGWVYYQQARPLLASDDRDQRKDGRELLERAREQLYLAAELTGGDPVVSEHLGDVYLLEGNKSRALEHYEEALRLEPREAEQPHLQQKLETLRKELRTR